MTATEKHSTCTLPEKDRLVGLEVKAFVSKAADVGSSPAFTVDLVSSRIIVVTSKLVLQC